MKLSSLFICSLLAGLCTVSQSCNKVSDPLVLDPVDSLATDTLPATTIDPTAGYSESHEKAKIIYVPSTYPAQIHAFDAADGHLVWTASAEGDYGLPVVVTNNIIAFKGQNDIITAVDTGGVRKWTYTLPEGLANSPIIAYHGTFLAETFAAIVAINAADGSLKWTLNKPAIPGCMGAGALSVSGGVGYSCGCSTLLAIDPDNGTMKWQSDYYTGLGSPVIFPERIFAAAQGSLVVLDTKTGQLIHTYDGVLEEGIINIRYGRLYEPTGNVIDSADPTKKHPRIQRASVNWSSLERGPLLADGFAMGSLHISDAIKGGLYCEPFFQPDFIEARGWISGATYLDGILYYTSGDRTMYDGGGAEINYSELYAFDVKNKTLKWKTFLHNPGLINTEPCVLGEQGGVYRGPEKF